MPLTLRNSPAWTLFLEDDRLIASAGADELYLLDELSPAEARALHAAWAAGDVSRARLDAIAHKLERLGVVYRVARAPAPAPTLRVRLHGLDAGGAIARALQPFFGDGLQRTDGDADLVVWFRERGTLFGAIAGHERAGAPQLFVDAAYHHTISLGPLVWPGETACLACLAGRIRHAWGDPAPPPAPAAVTSFGSAPLLAALVAAELERFRGDGSCPSLVERTVSFDLRTLATRSERVHRLPWCPSCFPPQKLHGAGSFELPWRAT